MKSAIPYLIAFIVVLIYSLIKGVQKYRQLTGASSPKKNIPGNWSRVDIDVNHCEVKSREYFEEPSEKSPSRIQILDSIVGKRPAEQHRVVSAIIYYHHYPDGHVQIFKSEPIYADETSVRYMLMNKDRLRLYVDPLERTNYYFGV
jgi:hypothetical protein